MRKIFVFSAILAFAVNITVSQEISPEESRQVARNFMLYKTGQSHKDVTVTQTEPFAENGKTLYRIHFSDPQGYIVVAADQRVRPVLAYSLSGDYSGFEKPPAFTAWMQQYARQIAHAINAENDAMPGVKELWEQYLSGNFQPKTGSKQVEPMLISTWNQGQFYNLMCPGDPGGPAGHCYTGCVATAMGQLCYYFRWPDTGTGSYTYHHPDYGTITADFGETTYQWNEMTNSLNSPNFAVATLLYHLGVSVDMDYGPDGSGMWNHKAAYSLRTFFNYAPETEYLYRDSTSIDWDSTIVAHLDKGIPMYYAGWSVPNVNGHAFIVDGYQDEEYFHFNWGWGGSYDGYFYLDELTPGGSNFNLAQELVINCVPDTNLYTYPPQCEGSDTLKSLAGTIDDGSRARYNYLNNTFCSWLIDPQTDADSVTYIKLTFDRLKTEEPADKITIYDGADDSAPLLGEFSGHALPQVIHSSGNKAFITFETNNSVTDEGWFISYQSVMPVWCAGPTVLSAPEGSFGDGSGSFNYRNSSACMWVIEPEFASEVTVTFTSFDTEPGKDIVKIFDSGTNQLLAEYSGHFDPGNMPAPVTSSSGKMLIAFSTDPVYTNPGWEAGYTVGNIGLNDIAATSPIRMHPNPAGDYITLSVTGEIFVNNLIISTLEGKTIENISISSQQNPLMINTSHLKPGVYLVTVKTSGGEFYHKLMKQ